MLAAAPCGRCANERPDFVLSAETLALQAILTNVLSRLRAADPALADAIATGLNDAENARGVGLLAPIVARSTRQGKWPSTEAEEPRPHD
jgi:hypothetical protein